MKALRSAVFADPALVALLDGPDPACNPPTDIFESMLVYTATIHLGVFQVVEASNQLMERQVCAVSFGQRAKVRAESVHGVLMCDMFAMQVLDQQPDQRVAALLHHRKQPHLLLEHVLFERVADRAQFINEAVVDAARLNRRGHGQ